MWRPTDGSKPALFAARLLENLIPKRRGQYYLYFHPDSDPSFRPLTDALDGVATRIVRAMVDPSLAEGGRRTASGRTRILVCRAGSLRGYFHFLRSRFVLASHPVTGLRVPARRKTVAFLSHGMPAKRFGRLIGEDIRIHADLCLSTSEVFSPAMVAGLGVAEQSIYIDHSPRVEAMCASVGDAVWAKLGVERDAYRGVVMWAPSFRGVAPVINARGIRTGVLASSQLLETLSRLVSQREYLLVIKRHPYEQGPAISGLANIVEIPQSRMDRVQVSLYEMLAATDLLITDVSSVWIDFLALDRPILIYLPDKNEFAKERGFVLEPYEEWSPSPLLLDEASLVQSLAMALQPTDEHALRRRRIARLLLPTLTADGASRRLIGRMNALAGVSQRV